MNIDGQPVVRVRHDRALLHEEGACLPLRSRHGQCRACALACPVGALKVSIEAVELSETCMGCGRCTAACPTQALSLPELAVLIQPVAPPTDQAPISRVECRKVPARWLAPNTVTVPCLGVLTPGYLLSWQAAGARVRIVDRGWCAGCEASGHHDASLDNPARAAFDATLSWLEAVQCPDRPVIAREPLPVAYRPAFIPPAPEEPSRLDRRSFFREALRRSTGRHPAAAAPMGNDGHAAYPADRRHPSPERERQLAALSTLARNHNTTIPAEFYPRLNVDASCHAHRLCVALCPTAALSVEEDQTGAAHLRWASECCIACGACVRGCPEGAIHLEIHGGQPGTRVLTSHNQIRCPSCQDTFTSSEGQRRRDAPELCPTCAKSRRFMEDGQRQLFGALRTTKD